MSKAENFDEVVKLLGKIESDDPYKNTKYLLVYKDYQIKNLKEELADTKTKLADEIKILNKRIEVLVDNEAFNGGRWVHHTDTSFLEEGKKYYVLVDGKIKRYTWELDVWWKNMVEVGSPEMYLVIHKPDLEGRVKGNIGDNYQQYLMKKLKVK